MADAASEAHGLVDNNKTVLDLGGLRFVASFRGDAGATLRVIGPVDGGQKEVLRFDDFIDAPHYHAPSDGPAIMFDRATLGEPLDWFVVQIRDHLDELLTAAGFAGALPALDLPSVAGGAEAIRKAMVECVPEGYIRVPGVGLQRAGT